LSAITKVPDAEKDAERIAEGVFSLSYEPTLCPTGSLHDSIMMTRLFDADIENEYRFVDDSDWRFATLFATIVPASSAPLLFWMEASKAHLRVIIRILRSFFFLIATTAFQIERVHFSDWCFPFLAVVITNVWIKKKIRLLL